MNGQNNSISLKYNERREQMIKAVNRNAALNYAKTLPLDGREYAIFDLGNEVLLIGKTDDVVRELAEDAAKAFASDFMHSLYDANANNDEDKLNKKTTLSNSFVEEVSKAILVAMEKEKISMAVIKDLRGPTDAFKKEKQKLRKK